MCVCRRLGVEHAATFEEVQEARNYLYEVWMPDTFGISISAMRRPLTANFMAVVSMQHLAEPDCARRVHAYN